MALYTIGDLHLSLGSDKPMDIFGEGWSNYVERIREGFSELGSEDVLLTVRAQYIRRILDNIGSNLIKYADPARPIEVRFLRQEGKAGLASAPGSGKHQGGPDQHRDHDG